jgi:hypothetical protein
MRIGILGPHQRITLASNLASRGRLLTLIPQYFVPKSLENQYFGPLSAPSSVANL